MNLRTDTRQRGRARRRRGGVAVEMAVVAPVLCLFLMAIVVGALGVFYNSQVSALAHESARWASVHGKQFAQGPGGRLATRDDVFQNVIAPRSAGMDASRLSYSVDWSDNGTTVAVTITYAWLPETLFGLTTFSHRAERIATY